MESLNEELLTACLTGNLEVVTQIVDSAKSNTAAIVNYQKSNGVTPLILASSKGNFKIVEFLISKGADINIKDNAGDSPLMCAAWNGQYEIARLLISKKSDLDFQNKKGNSALFNAIIRKQPELAALLINAGCNLNLLDNEGNTALNCASLYSQKEIAVLLITKGADINILNYKGETSMSTAIRMGLTEVTALLESKGVKKTKSDLKLERIAENDKKEALKQARNEKSGNIDLKTGIFITTLVFFTPLTLMVKLIFSYALFTVNTQDPAFSGIANIEALCVIVLIIFSVISGIKLWRIAPNATKFTKVFLIFLLTFIIFDFAATRIGISMGVISKNSEILKESIKLYVGAIIYCVYYIIYLSSSPDVRETYMN